MQILTFNAVAIKQNRIRRVDMPVHFSPSSGPICIFVKDSGSETKGTIVEIRDKKDKRYKIFHKIWYNWAKKLVGIWQVQIVKNILF